jgi:hypothetical protein
LCLGASNLAAHAEAAATSLQWTTAPSLLPPGAMVAVVSGNPAGPGRPTIQLSMPNGYGMPPHFHPTDERVEVKQGTLLIGLGDRLDPRRRWRWPLAIRPSPPRASIIIPSPKERPSSR